MFFNLTPELLIARLIAVGLGMTIHEFAHNYVAHRMGDPVPRQLGKLTLNPLAHINWLGWLMFGLIGFGILGSAPISPNRMPIYNRRWRWLAAVAAGPISNLLLAVAVAIIWRLLEAFGVVGALPGLLVTILIQIVFFNVLLFIFNLIPLFPLDGWQVVYALLPPAQAYTWEKYQQTTFYIFIGLIALSFIPIGGFNPLGILISEPTFFIIRLLLG